MSIFTTILKAIGIGNEPAAAEKPAADKPAANKSAVRVPDITKMTEVKRAPVEAVDVAEKLDAMAKVKNQDPQNWRVSIVELLKLLDIDSSHENRVELAKELGIPQEKLGGDSAEMNLWLHKQVMNKIAQNGGIVPKELKD